MADLGNKKSTSKLSRIINTFAILLIVCFVLYKVPFKLQQLFPDDSGERFDAVTVTRIYNVYSSETIQLEGPQVQELFHLLGDCTIQRIVLPAEVKGFEYGGAYDIDLDGKNDHLHLSITIDRRISYCTADGKDYRLHTRPDLASFFNNT